jgi:hypothetical protein
MSTVLPSPTERIDVKSHIDRRDLPRPPALSDLSFTRTLNAVTDLDLDPTGKTPIQGTISRALRDGTRINVPPGTYRLSGEIKTKDLRNFAIVGMGGNQEKPIFKVDSGITGNVVSFLGGLSSRNCAFVNVRLDMNAKNCSAQTRFDVATGLVVTDIDFAGYSDPDDSGKKIIPQIRDSNGVGRVERCTLVDGTEVGREGVPHNDEHKQQYDGGIYCGPKHEGTVYVLDCAVANSSISQVRLSHEDSFVGGGVSIEIDRERIPDRNNPSGMAPARGVWLEPGKVHGNQGVVIGECHFRMGRDTPHVPGLIVCGSDYGNTTVLGPVYMTVDGEHRAIAAKTPSGRDGEAPPKPHWWRIQNVTIKGSGKVRPALVEIEDRPNSYVRNCCIEHTGAGVNGIRFVGSRGEVSDSTVNVKGTHVSNAETRNVSKTGSCALKLPENATRTRAP